MKRRLLLLMLLCLLLFDGCRNKNREKMVGIWQLRVMDVNGAQLHGASIGNWLWEFNEEGGYLAEIAGAKEKGRYKCSNSTLTLLHPADKKPPQVFKITKLDSLEMDLVLTENNTTTSFTFIKRPDTQPGAED